MNKIHITIIFGILSLGAMAQKSDSSIGSEVVNVIGTYTPTISDAFKVKETPSFDDETVTKREEINYSISSFPVASTFTPAKGSAEMVEKSEKEKYFSNYASLGFGNYGTILGELFVTHNLSSNQYIGGMLKHHSSQGGIKDVVLDDFFYDTSIDLTYATFEEKYGWNVDLGYRNQIYNWYGLPVDYVAFDEESLKFIDEKQSYNSFYLGGKFKLNESIFKGAEVYYKRFWDAYDSGENRFWLKPSFDVDIAATRVRVDVIADYVGTNYSGDAHTSDSKYSYFNFGVQPSFIYQQDDLSVRVGAGLFLASGKANDESESKFFVYPQIQASYKVVGDLMIAYAGAEGTLQQNSYADLVNENPFIAPHQAITPTDRQYEIYVGLKGKLASNMAYNVRGSYMSEKSKVLYGTQFIDILTDAEGYVFGNSISVLYDDVKTFGLFGELKADIKKDVSVFVNGTFNGYSTDLPEAWYLPNVRFNAGTDIAITDKLIVNANIFCVGNRKAQFYNENSTDEPILKTETLDGYFDVNLGGNYKFNERLSFFLKLNNLANQKYEKWLNFPVQGFQVLGGASYKFDF